MILAISYMIGAYIITKMFAILMPKGEPEKPFVQILAGVTILVVIICILILIVKQQTPANIFNP